MNRIIDKQCTVPENCGSQRFDVVASELFPEFSRAKLQEWIRSGQLTLDGRKVKPRERLQGGEKLVLQAEIAGVVFGPEDIALDIIYEDEDIIVINKPAGFVVHPGAGHPGGTLMNALLFYCSGLSAIPRAGIVHRLDKDTSGLLVVAKTLESHVSLVRQLQGRSVKRTYEAVVYGRLNRGGQISAPVGRHPAHRTRMAISQKGKEAITRYNVIKAYAEHTHLELMLETGRTHQIRVHLQYLRFPIIGDAIYGGTYRQPRVNHEDLANMIKRFSRQALHARKLSFIHPSSEEIVEFEVSLPEDFRSLIAVLNAAGERA